MERDTNNDNGTDDNGEQTTPDSPEGEPQGDEFIPDVGDIMRVTLEAPRSSRRRNNDSDNDCPSGKKGK